MMDVTLEGIVPAGMVVGGKEKPDDKGLKTDGQGGRRRKPPRDRGGAVGVGVATPEVLGAAASIGTCGRDPALSPG